MSVPDIRGAVCGKCGKPLKGMGIDTPDGWLCALDCPRRWVRVQPEAAAKSDA